MIPQQILEKIDRPALKVMLLERLKLYIDVNPVHKVILVGTEVVTKFLMDVTMPFFDDESSPLPEWLTEWWILGFKRRGIGSEYTLEHSDFVAYAAEIITEVYWERKNETK